jgi:hypothetical protein
MNKLLVTFLVAFVLASGPRPLQAQKFEYAKKAEFDAQGNIYVSSDKGKLLWMANTEHCSEAHVANDLQTVGCAVVHDPEPGNPLPCYRLEIYRKGGAKETIEPGATIRDWHFWKDGEQVAVYYGPRDGQGTYALYDSATARVIEKLGEPPNEGLLPQWAKSQAQIQDESVPTSVLRTEERTKWIGKALRQISKIQPGMRRKDLLEIFTTEGGLSTRTQRTYVFIECRYIKVTVGFKPVSSQSTGLDDDPDDIIESISQPYLAWGVAD